MINADDEGDGDSTFEQDADELEQKRLSDERQRAVDMRAAIGLKRLMQDSDARAWIWRLLKMCHPFEISFRSDPLNMSFKEGERNIGNFVIGEIQTIAADEYALMTREAKAEGQ